MPAGPRRPRRASGVTRLAHRIARQLAADDELLRVPARDSGRNVHPRGAHVESATMRSVSRRAAARSSRPSRPGRANGGRAGLVAETSSPTAASSPGGRTACGLRGRTPSRPPGGPACRRGQVAPVEHDPARRGVPHPHDRLDQLRLPLPSTPAMPSTSPACTIRSTSASNCRPSSPAPTRPSTRSTSRLRHRRLAGARVRQLAADHHLGGLAAAGDGGAGSACAGAPADYRDAVGDGDLRSARV